jgi:mono/diheme cytochrome c family protein
MNRLLSLCLVLSGTAAAAGTVPPPQYPVAVAPYTAEFRSVSLQQLVDLGLNTGIWNGSPKVRKDRQWYDENFYATLAAKKVWHPGTSPYTHERAGPITWDIVPIPQAPPPPCDKPQPTGYDAEGCRYANALFKDLEKKDPAAARIAREQVRRGRDVWFKGTFGDQDEEYLHTSRTVGAIWYPWLDTRTRKTRFSKWGMINDPDCSEGDASTNWYDRCPDPHSSGVLGYRKYFADPTLGPGGKVAFDPASSPYRDDELKKNLRYVLGGPCVQCHVAFDPTHPPADPNAPAWENIHATIGNQFTNQPLQYLQGVPDDHFAKQVIKAARPGTVDTSLQASDFQHNPGTQNNIMDFFNKRVFEEEMKDPITGEVRKARTRHVLKGGEDSVGEVLALIRVYVNIGMCTEECWVPKFPVPGKLWGEESHQRPFRISECSRDCEAWNYTDAKMPELAAFLITGGPTYLMKAKDVDGTPGAAFIDVKQVPRGRKVFARECAACHSSKYAPDSVRADRAALERFYEGHVFGSEQFWQYEFADEERNSKDFKAKFMAADAHGKLRPKQFADASLKGGDVLGQDWLSNDEPVAFHVIGTNMCRALHDNHNEGHIWEEFSSETYKHRPSPGAVPKVVNRMLPVAGGRAWDEKAIEGGPGYLRNFSLLSAWATAPFLHNNSVGELTYLPDGAIDYTVRGRVTQFHKALDELLTSDNPDVNPHRPQKTTVIDQDIKVAPREDGQGFVKLPVAKGTPVAYLASSDPHSPLYMKCDDLVENKGHQFGIDLSKEDKAALAEFLKLM